MSNQLDHFDTQLQAEDAAFVAMFEDACYAAFLRETAEVDASEVEEDLYARDFINSQEEKDAYDEERKEARKQALMDTDGSMDESDWKDYV